MNSLTTACNVESVDNSFYDLTSIRMARRSKKPTSISICSWPIAFLRGERMVVFKRIETYGIFVIPDYIHSGSVQIHSGTYNVWYMKGIV